MKKQLFIVTLILLVGILFSVYDHYSNSFTGTTTNAYVATEAIECSAYSQKYILITNTGATYALLYKLYGYPTATSTYYEVAVAETSVAAGGVSDPIKRSFTPYAKLVLQVKWVTGATTYSVGYNLIP